MIVTLSSSWLKIVAAWAATSPAVICLALTSAASANPAIEPDVQLSELDGSSASEDAIELNAAVPGFAATAPSSAAPADAPFAFAAPPIAAPAAPQTPAVAAAPASTFAPSSFPIAAPTPAAANPSAQFQFRSPVAEQFAPPATGSIGGTPISQVLPTPSVVPAPLPVPDLPAAGTATPLPPAPTGQFSAPTAYPPAAYPYPAPYPYPPGAIAYPYAPPAAAPMPVGYPYPPQVAAPTPVGYPYAPPAAAPIAYPYPAQVAAPAPIAYPPQVAAPIAYPYPYPYPTAPTAFPYSTVPSTPAPAIAYPAAPIYSQPAIAPTPTAPLTQAPVAPFAPVPVAPPVAQQPTPPPVQPLIESSALTPPSLRLQGVYRLQGDESSARARLSAVYPLTPNLLFGGSVDLTEGEGFADSQTEGLSLNELYLAASLPDLPNLRFVIGQLDLTSYFDRNSFAKDGASQFFNPVFQTNPALSAAAIGSRPGVLVNWSLNDNIEARAAAFSSDRSISDFQLDGFAGELGLRFGNAIIRGTYTSGRDGGSDSGFNQIFGLDRGDGQFGISENDREESYGVNAEVFIPELSLGLFGRYGHYENRDLGEGGDTFSAGLTFLDVFSQNDRLGLAYGRALSNDRLRRQQDERNPDVLELYYDFRALPNVNLGFSVQQRDEFSETILGVRVRSEFDVTPGR